MDILNTLKNAFPKPRVPQKRYLALIGLVVYLVAKVYVASTPSPHDDQLPDQLRDAVTVIFAAEEEKPDPSSDYDADGLRYGEGYS